MNDQVMNPSNPLGTVEDLCDRLHALQRDTALLVRSPQHAADLERAIARLQHQIQALQEPSLPPWQEAPIHVSSPHPIQALLQNGDAIGQALLNSGHQGIAVFDQQLICQVWNGMMETLMGHSRAIALHCALLDILDMLEPEDVDDLQQRVLQAGTSIGFDRWTTEAADANRHYISLQFSPLYSPEGPLVGVLLIAIDLTPRKRLEQRLRQWALREAALNRVIQLIRDPLDLNQVFITAAQELTTVLQADQTAIFQYTAAGLGFGRWLGLAHYREAQGLPSALGLEFSTSHNSDDQLHQGHSCYATLDPSPNDATSAITTQLMKRCPGGWLMLPLWVDGCLWGGVSLHHQARSPLWTATDIDLAQTVTTQLAIAIQRTSLYTQVQQLNINLERQVRARTAELQLASDFEVALKRITDRVRDKFG